MTSGKTEKPQVVFFGSGPVAAACLELLMQHCIIEAVITKPRPPHHKYDVPVLSLADKHQLPVITASTKHELDDVITTHQFSSQIAVLIDFGIIVSQRVIDYFPLGIINSHFSLLPHLRGADPITWAIANGDPKTGVSLMCIDTGMDTGKLITYRSLSIAHDDTSLTLTNKLVHLSNELLQEFLPRYLAGDVTPRTQPHLDRATYSRKLTKADGTIDWYQPAVTIERRIRAFIEWPQSRARLGTIDCIITKATVIPGTSSPGRLGVTDGQLHIGTSDGLLSILHLKPAGKKEMPIQAFLAGYKDKLHN